MHLHVEKITANVNSVTEFASWLPLKDESVAVSILLSWSAVVSELQYT